MPAKSLAGISVLLDAIEIAVATLTPVSSNALNRFIAEFKLVFCELNSLSNSLI